MLEDGAGEAARRHGALLPHIRDLHRLYRLLAKARARRGAIDFETIETEMVFDARGKIERIVPVRAQRRASPDRGVHAGGQRVRLGFPARARPSHALPRARGADAGEARGAARVSQGLRAGADRRRQAARAPTTRSCWREVEDAAGRAAAADGDAALARSRRSTAPTTSATSGSPTSPTRISPRRSAATRICWCTARSRRRSGGAATSRETGASWGCTAR